MTCYIHIFDEPEITLWGLSNSQRIERELARDPSTRQAKLIFVTCLEDVPPDNDITLLRGDHLYDVRVLVNLIQSRDSLLTVEKDGSRTPVAAKIHMASAPAVIAHIRDPGNALPPGIETTTPAQLVPPSQIRLKKAHTPFVLPISPARIEELETKLFKTAYKGVTDLVTKWVWPIPAQFITRVCTRFGLTPNQVTATSWVLAIVAGLLFYNGAFASGLLVGWIMTFLDTVDGKLARVTVTSSPMGNYFDHVLDLLHPPFWYLAWGLGLASLDTALLPADLTPIMWLIFTGYILGRVVEGIFSQWIGKFGIYSWRPIDSFNRLITARRNPCLIILTVGLVFSRPDLALEAVAVWTVVSTLFLLFRLGMAVFTRFTSGPMRSWLTEIDPAGTDRSLASRWFSQ